MYALWVVEGVDRVYRALGEPIRRQILDLLAERERPVKELVRRFPVSQPALSQHLRVLRDAGLVRVRREGRLHVYSIDPRPLREVHQWSGRYRPLWVLLSGPGPG